MNYSLHPEAEEDLRAAAEFYRDRAGNSLSQSLLAEFEQSVNMQLTVFISSGNWSAPPQLGHCAGLKVMKSRPVKFLISAWLLLLEQLKVVHPARLERATP